MDFSSLNEAQRRAATFTGKHLLVLAGAGTGKTRVIIARALWLMEQGVDPTTIRILSFTKKSAGEIVDRIKAEAEDIPAAKELHGSTFHSWCMELIERYPDEFGMNGFVPIDAPTSEAIRIQLGLSDPPGDYETYKKDRRYIDFDDMLEVVADTMAGNPELRTKIAGDYTNILIDEMQDTNPLQWRLLESFFDVCHLFCVGDDAQSIYAFRGADFRSIHSFKERVPDGEVLKLTDNYRSTQEILALSNWLLRQSPLEYDKDLHAVRGKGQIPELYFCGGRSKEAQILLAIIQRGLLAGKKYSDYMILSRTSKRVEELTDALKDADIPVFQMGGKKNSIEKPHVRDVIDALRIIINCRDEISWRRFLKLWAFRGWFNAPAFIETAMNSSSLDEALSNLPRTDAVSQKIVDCLSSARNCWSEPAAAFGVILSYMAPILSRRYQDWEACMHDLESVRLMAVTCETIPSFVGEYASDPVAALIRHGVDEEKSNSVIISTVHSAKGLECDTVIVLEREFPSFWCQTDDDFEEERRILYVALTRAKNSLILTTFNHQRLILPEENGAIQDETRRLLDAEPFLRGLPDGLITTFPKPGVQRPYTASVDIDTDFKVPELPD